jgi:hypothetical protein
MAMITVKTITKILKETVEKMGENRIRKLLST